MDRTWGLAKAPAKAAIKLVCRFQSLRRVSIKCIRPRNAATAAVGQLYTDGMLCSVDARAGWRARPNDTREYRLEFLILGELQFSPIRLVLAPPRST